MSRVSLVMAGLLMVGILAPLAWGGAFSGEENAQTSAARHDTLAPATPGLEVPGGSESTLPLGPDIAEALPHDPGVRALAFDDFEWCAESSCSLSSAQPVLSEVQLFRYTVASADSWLVNGTGLGVGGGHAARAVQDGAQFEVQVRAAEGVLGAPWRVSFAAKAPTLGVLGALDGGLDVRVSWRSAGAVVGPLDCGYAPVAPAADDFFVYVPTNPLCAFSPHTTEVWLSLTARADSNGVLPLIAVDNLLVERIEQ